MSESWYKKSMPKIKDFAPLLPEIAKALKQLDGVQKVYVWGSFAEHRTKPEYRIKDLDVIIGTTLCAEDLISINDEVLKSAGSVEALEEEGFHPLAVKFSRDLNQLDRYRLDKWAVSKENRLLHWGPIFNTKEEADAINKDAEEYANEKTGTPRQKLHRASDKSCKNWYNSYRHFMGYYLNNMPSGWYQSEDADIPNILLSSVEI